MAGLSAYKLWDIFFSKQHLEELFVEKIKKKSSVGLDWITTEKFEEQLDDNIDIILRKCCMSTYKFTHYRELLISKGAGKPPRCISIPTVRDKLVFAALYEILNKVYSTATSAPMPQTIINDIKATISNPQFDTYVKTDIKSFYASIDHDVLIKAFRSKIRKKEICNLIEKAIRTKTSRPNSLSSTGSSNKGVPEGLSISNALANIYMQKIDNKYAQQKQLYRYWRYVDDIIILTSHSEAEYMVSSITADFSKLKLDVNIDKTEVGKTSAGFEYLGYYISTSTVSVRRSSIINLERSIEMIFRKYHKSQKPNINYLKWKINLKVTGFIIDNNKYGWLFFYSQITDLKCLAHLDWLIDKFALRFGIDEKIRFKKFLRAYNEISKALHTTRYIPNLDQLTISQKRNIVQEIYGENEKNMVDDFVEMRFRKLMNKEIRNIQRDVQPFS